MISQRRISSSSLALLGSVREIREFKEFFKEFRENHLDYCVIVMFFGFRGYSRREYDEKERYGAAKFI